MKRVLIAILRFYNRHISPLLPNACIYTPTCSEYAMEAIQKHGVFKGTGLAIWLVLRCNPFHEGGYDPVPEPKKHKENRS